MRQKVPRIPKARNNAAHTSLQNYFDRVSNSLEDRIAEFLQMRKFTRVYEESQKLLEIEKTLNIAAGSIFEINLENKVDQEAVQNIVYQLNQKYLALKKFLQGKPFSLQVQLLHEITKQTQIVGMHVEQILKNIIRINEVVPVIKALLKMKDKEGEHEKHDRLLNEIANSLKKNINEPNLIDIKRILLEENINLSKFDANLNFEHLNDVSDKLIGLLNDKLLLVISVSETLIAGVEDDGTNDVDFDKRLPDELRVLFLASNTLDIFYKIKEIRNCIRTIFSGVKVFLKIMESGKLGKSLEGLLKRGDNNIHDTIINSAKYLKRLAPVISETATSLDALDLKLKLNTLDLHKVLMITYGLIYEKSNRSWENPYEVMYQRAGKDGKPL